MIRTVTRLAVVALVSAPVMAQQAPVPAPAARPTAIVQRILVKVNGEIFTQSDLTQWQADALREQNKTVPSPADLSKDAALVAAMQEVTPEVLVQAVDNLLLVQYAREAGYRFTDQVFQETLTRIKEQNKIDDAQLRQALQQQGMTLDSFRADTERAWLRRQVEQGDVMDRAKVTDQELRQYYEKNMAQFMTPVTITVREVFVPVAAGSSAADEDAARMKIVAARERATKGEDFVKIVTEISESGTKANGGLIGPVNLVDLDPTMRATFEKLKAGDVTDPLRTRAGFQIFKLEARTDSTQKTFDAVREEIGSKIFADRFDQKMEEFLKKIRAQALIEWKDPALKQLYDKRLADRAVAGK